MADIQNAIAAGKQVTIHEQSIQYYDWHGEGFVVTDPATGAAAYMLSGGLAGGGTAQKADIMGLSFNQILAALNFLCDVGGGTFKFLSKAIPANLAKWVEGFGNGIAILSAFSSGLDMYEDTNCQWKAGASAGVDFLLSMLASQSIGYLLGYYFAGSLLASILAPLIVAIVVGFVFYLLSVLAQKVIKGIKYCYVNSNKSYIIS